MAVQVDILRERGKQMVLEDDARNKISVSYVCSTMLLRWHMY